MLKRTVGKHAVIFDPKDPDSVSRTKQSFTKDANINNIMARYMKTGVLGSGVVSSRVSAFADVSSGDSYRSVLDKVRNAEEAFMTLDADVRSKFRNNVSELLDFLADPANRDEAIELGLVEPPEPPPGAPLEAAPVVEPVEPVVEPVVPSEEGSG